MTRRKLVAGVLLLVALLLGIDTLAWLALEQRLDRTLVRVTQQAAGAGWKLDTAPGRRGGWPLTATLTLARPTLARPILARPGAAGPAGGPDSQGIVWSGGRITAVLSPWHPRRIAFIAGDLQVISAAGSGLSRSLRFWGDSLVVHLPLGTDSPTSIGFDAAALHLALPGTRPDGVVTIGRLHGDLRWTLEAHALTLTLRDLVLPGPGTAARAGLDIPQAALELSLIGSAGNPADSLTGRLRDWQAGGGRLLLRQAALIWPDARIDAAGHASLDRDFRSDGGFTVTMTGADALLDRWALTGRLAPSTASAVRAVLGLIAAGRPPDSGALPRPLQLWLTLRAGLLSLGQIPLLRVPAFPGMIQPQGADPSSVGALP